LGIGEKRYENASLSNMWLLLERLKPFDDSAQMGDLPTWLSVPICPPVQDAFSSRGTAVKSSRSREPESASQCHAQVRSNLLSTRACCTLTPLAHG
jgi:hypothetical protein